MSDKADTAPGRVSKKVKITDALDMLADTERKELAQRIGVLVRRRMGWVPPPDMVNRKLKRRIDSIMRSGEAHTIANAIARRYKPLRDALMAQSKKGETECTVNVQERSKSK